MVNEIQVVVDPETAHEEILLKRLIAKTLNIAPNDISKYRILRKSIDARQRDIKFNLKIQVFVGEQESSDLFRFKYRNVAAATHVIVVGAGPAGLFAALKLIELGLKPVIFERGKDVSSRKHDIAMISRQHVILPDSNYCFGEGGAGTFSDGKLYTRSTKRGDQTRILQMLHFHGADESVLYDAHPHIGTDKLPEVIRNMRKTILDCGGEINFNARVENLLVNNGSVQGVSLAGGENFKAGAIILSTGHSARDIYEMLNRQGIAIEGKAFAMGVRVEHPQELIDSIQYHRKVRGKYLPAASYNLAQQVGDRGVYSFCMCPGGYIVPSATANNEIVVNGMSSSKRHTPFANSGIVVEIKLPDLKDYVKFGALAGLEYQLYLEHLSKQNGGPGQTAPAQRLTDFLSNKISGSLPTNSYTPGLMSSPLHSWMPDIIKSSLQAGFKAFDKKMKGFVTSEACIAGVESRTSSPVRIPRDNESMQHIQVKGLFPCGEGAGYAGGIVSSAMDGENAALKLSEYLKI